MKNFTKKIQENIFRYGLFLRNAKIIVGVSGGPDSVCLLDLLRRIQKKYGLEIIIAHVNYNLRGKDSELDEKLVSNLAKKYFLPLEIKKIPAISYQLSAIKSEDHLRNIRYEFFEKLRKKYQADAIAVGHNLNDQGETVIMRVLRGTGLRGLRAIKFKNGNIIRPFLNIYRKDILAYLKENKLPFRVDKTNLKADFTRNKIRNKLIPYLEKEFNPNIQENLFKLSQSVSDDYDFINSFAKEWLRHHRKPTTSEISSLSPSLQKEVLRQKIEELSPGLKEVSFAHIDEILKVVSSAKSKNQKIALKGLKIARKGDKLILERKN